MPETALLLVILAFYGCSDPSGDAPPRQAGQTVEAEPVGYQDGGAILMDTLASARLIAEDPLWAEALRIHYDAVVVDGHIDTPSLILDEGYDFSEAHSGRGDSHVDLPRMIAGGLDAAFFSIYVARSFGEGPPATERAEAMIDAVEEAIERTGGRAALATSADDILRLSRQGRKAILLGLEGGHALQASEEVLEALYRRGVRYVTLTHNNTNRWADSSQDEARWGGLNERGRALVRAMNRLGVLVDLSHVSDSTFFDALAVSEAPVILSHSSVRALNPHARNVTDDMLRALAANEGVIMINFYSSFVAQEERRATVEDILDHIDHAVHMAGVDHVGLGSDFDGVPALPRGMEDVTRLPWITYGLLRRGYSEPDVRKILGGNVLRVLREAEAAASRD